jgi:hypothetical protein
MQEVELTSSRLARVWWAFTWRFTALWLVLLALSIGAFCLFGVVLTKLGVLDYHGAARMVAHAFIATTIAGVPVAGIVAVRVVLQNRFGGFRLGLLPVQPEADAGPESLAAAS